MGLQNSDIILVERSSTLYRETYGNRANIDSTDLLLVDRGGTLYKCAYSDWPNANSSDLILVERGAGAGAAMYKETKSNWPTTGNVDIHSANYMVTLGTLLYGQSSTQRANNYFSVVEVQAEFSSSATIGDGTLYVGFRNSASTAYYGDLPLAALQILKSNGTTVIYAYNFGTWAYNNSNPIYADWGTTDSSEDIPPGDGVITVKTTNPGTFSYVFTGNTATNGIRRFSFTDTGTVSSYVGSARGISSSTYTNATSTTVLPVGNANIPQSSSSDDGYLFSECSSTAQGDLTWMGVALYGDDLDNGDRIRICYFGGGNGQSSSNGLQTTDSLYVRYVED
tara:strand:+ start:1504 stop:2517 length:1014 start_codon:yes stop_codon:yes gene_type:complete